MQNKYKYAVGVTFIALVALWLHYSNEKGSLHPQFSLLLLSSNSKENNDVAAEKLRNKNQNEKELIKIEICENMYATAQSPDALEQSKQLALGLFVKNLSVDGYSYPAIEVVGDVAGVNKRKINLAFSGFGRNEYLQNFGETILMADDYANRRELSGDLRQKFQDSKWDYNSLLEYLEQNKIPKDAVVFGRPILQMLIEKGAALSEVQVNDLIANGIKIDLASIASAIEQGWPTPQIKMLADNYGRPLDTTWLVNDLSMNLTLLSTRKLRKDLFKYFNNEKNVSAAINDGFGRINILDVLPVPENEMEKEAVNAFATSGLKFGLRPTKYSSLQRLQKVLKPEIKETYADSFSIIRSEDEPVIEKGKELKSILNDFDTKIAFAKTIQQRCVAELSYSVDSYVEQLIKAKTNPSILHLETKRLVSKSVKNDFSSQWNNPQKRIDTLKALGTNARVAFASQDFREFTKKLSSLTMENKWNEAFQLSQQLGEAQGYSEVLRSYLWSDKPEWSFVKQLLDAGAKVDESLIIPIARKGHVDLLERLGSYGLNTYNYTDYKGENALSYAAQGNSLAMINYLIQHGVPVKPEIMGLDPLDLVLDELGAAAMIPEKTKNYADIVIALLVAGAPIELSHKEAMESLRIMNPQAYEVLASYFSKS